MENAFGQENQKSHRAYEGMPKFSMANKQTMEQIMTMAATLELRYLAYQEEVSTGFDEQIPRLDQSLMFWQKCVNDFRNALNFDENVTHIECENVYAGLKQITDRLIDLQTKVQIHKK